MNQTSAMAEGRALPVFKSDMEFCNDSAMLSEVSWLFDEKDLILHYGVPISLLQSELK